MTTARVLRVVNFDVGMSIEAEYENSRDNTGRLHLNLRKDEDNYVLHFNPRFQEKILVLNSKEGGTLPQASGRLLMAMILLLEQK